MESAEAVDWRAVYSASSDDSDTDPLPLMAHQDATAGPLIAPYLATEPSIVVKVRASCCTLPSTEGTPMQQ